MEIEHLVGTAMWALGRLCDHWGLCGTKSGFLVQVGKTSRYPPMALWQQACLKVLQKVLKPGLSATLLFLGYLGTVTYFVD